MDFLKREGVSVGAYVAPGFVTTPELIVSVHESVYGKHPNEVDFMDKDTVIAIS
jgi:hypothetical protein